MKLSRWLKRFVIKALYGEEQVNQGGNITTSGTTTSDAKHYGTDTDEHDGWSDHEYEINEENTLPPGRYR